MLGTSMLGRKVSLLVLGFALAMAGSTGAEGAPPSTFRETATVTLIEVPVVVLRGGAPVRDLDVDDFVLSMDGEVQVIEGFERVDLSLATLGDAQTRAEPVSLAGRRYFLMAFDLSHTQPANARRSVEAARELLEEGLSPSDMVGVSIYGATAGARLLHPFTSDRARLQSALLAVEAVTSRDPQIVEQARATLEAKGGATGRDLLRFLEEIRSFVTQQGVGLSSTVGPAGEWLAEFDTSGRGGILAETLQDMENFYQEDITYITRDRSLDYLETLAELATALEEVRGQKYFVLFSEGIDQSFFEDYSNTQGTQRLRKLLRDFRQSGWIMHSVNVSQQPGVDRGMFAFVTETNGREYRDFGDLETAMGQMLDQTSVSYVLSFQPGELAAEGGYHEIEVRLRGQDDAKLMHRDGFSALQPAGLREEKDFLVATADRVASKRDGGPFDVSVMAIPFKGPTETGVVRTVVEIEGPGLLVDDERTLMTLDIETYLIDEEVGAVALSTRRLALDLTNQADLIRGGGVKVLEEHLLGTGDHRLRIVLRDREKGRLSIASALVRVPDFETGEPQLFEPVFPELSRHWLVVRDGEGTQGDVSENPFQFGGKRFLPRVEVRLASGASVPVCVMAFDLPAEMSAVEVALLDSDGETAEGLSVGWASEPERGDDGLVRRLAKLDTSTVTPGRYQIRVSYGGDSEGSNKVASRWIEIR